MGREAWGRRGLALSVWSEGEEPGGKGLFTSGQGPQSEPHFPLASSLPSGWGKRAVCPLLSSVRDPGCPHPRPYPALPEGHPSATKGSRLGGSWGACGSRRQTRWCLGAQGSLLGIPKTNVPGGSRGRASACNSGDPGSIPGLEDVLEKEMATQSSTLPGESHGAGAW